MNIVLKACVRLYLFVVLAAVFIFATAAHAQSYVEGISEVLPSTTSTTIYTFTNTYITYDLTAYYSPYTEAYLYDNGSFLVSNYTYTTDGQNAPLDGRIPNIKTGDDYEVDGAHYLTQLYVFDDGNGGTYYENPYQYGFTEGNQSSGYDYSSGGGDYYTYVSNLFLGYTAAAISTAVPQITGVSPSGAARGTSGQITVTGSHLVDVFDGTTTPTVLSGSGLSLTTGSLSATQVTLNYSIDGSAATGARQFTLSNRFGQSEPQTFTVGDPSPVVADVEPHLWPAGTVIPLTITGSGFGIAPTVTIAGVGVLTPSPAATGSDTSISTSVSIALDAPDGPATVTVQSHGSGGNGFVQGTPGQSSSGSNGAVIVAFPAPAPTIVLGSGTTGVCTSGSPVTSSQNVVVGQPITFTGCIPPSGTPLVASETWSPDGKFSAQTAVAGFTVSFDGTSQFTEALTQISNTSCAAGQYCDFNKFYFVTPGTYTFTFSYLANNGTTPPSVSITFVVAGPNLDSRGNFMEGPDNNTPPTAGPVQIYGVGQYFGQLTANTTPELANGNNEDTNGMELTVTGTAPTGFSGGDWRFVQVINQLSYSYTSSPTSSPFVLQPGLDTLYPHSSANILFMDSPGMVLDPTHFGRTQFVSVGEESESAKFTTYLLWDPQIATDGSHDCSLASSQQASNGSISYSDSTCVSIPIPMASLSWGFAGDALKTLNPGQGAGTNTWILQCGTANTPGLGAAGYPNWTFTENARYFNQ
ncbi:hypothetical protein RBB75_07970 [Tunturibacter empetritectus]|uniref:IPT/TIG domain-containing protein n=1 Tax=Tunturiibacter empetritectus TaxID=3069691 RepID=A0AAU7ZHG6_9BACT